MNAILLIEITTALNFVLLMMLTIFLIRGNRSAPRTAIQGSQADITNPVDLAAQTSFENGEKTESIRVSSLKAEPEKPLSNGSADYAKAAINRLKKGDAPELVAREYGYSRSEIGILKAASMRRTRT
jgi:hypothetical protein